MGLEAGWNCHVSLMAAESVASDNSSSRNLSSLCNNVQGEAADGPMSDSVSNPQGLIRSRDLTTGSLSLTNPLFVPRTQSAPSFVNTQEVQVVAFILFHKFLLYILKQCMPNNSITVTEIIRVILKDGKKLVIHIVT